MTHMARFFIMRNKAQIGVLIGVVAALGFVATTQFSLWLAVPIAVLIVYACVFAVGLFAGYLFR